MTILATEDADKLALEHQEWTESIARSVARAWSMDWKLDGLDGAAFEALLFCARRFDPSRGVPFRGYARKRIHEASTEAARRSRGWKRGTGSRKDEIAREVSAELFNIYPELRLGELPLLEEGGGDSDENSRAAIRHLLISANMASAKHELSSGQPDELLEYKRLVEKLAGLEPVHQSLMWKLYWEGESLRTIATGWDTDELNVIREHKVLLGFLLKSFATKKTLPIPRVRPGLKNIALKLRKRSPKGEFSKAMSSSG